MQSVWPSGLRRQLQVLFFFGRRGFEPLSGHFGLRTLSLFCDDSQPAPQRFPPETPDELTTSPVENRDNFRLLWAENSLCVTRKPARFGVHSFFVAPGAHSGHPERLGMQNLREVSSTARCVRKRKFAPKCCRVAESSRWCRQTQSPPILRREELAVNRKARLVGSTSLPRGRGGRDGKGGSTVEMRGVRSC